MIYAFLWLKHKWHAYEGFFGRHPWRSTVTLSNWKEEGWKKKQGFIGIRTCDLRNTGAMLYQLSYEATHLLWWSVFTFIYNRFTNMNCFIQTSHHFTAREDIGLAPNVCLHSSVGRASHRYCGGHAFESCWSPKTMRHRSPAELTCTSRIYAYLQLYVLHVRSQFVAPGKDVLFVKEDSQA